jgi:hypothetical protein
MNIPGIYDSWKVRSPFHKQSVPCSPMAFVFPRLLATLPRGGRNRAVQLANRRGVLWKETRQQKKKWRAQTQKEPHKSTLRPSPPRPPPLPLSLPHNPRPIPPSSSTTADAPRFYCVRRSPQAMELSARGAVALASRIVMPAKTTEGSQTPWIEGDAVTTGFASFRTVPVAASRRRCTTLETSAKREFFRPISFFVPSTARMER